MWVSVNSLRRGLYAEHHDELGFLYRQIAHHRAPAVELVAADDDAVVLALAVRRHLLGRGAASLGYSTTSLASGAVSTGSNSAAVTPLKTR